MAFFFSTNLNAGNKIEVSLEQIVEMRSVSSAKVSPNGKYIAHTLLVPRNVYVDKGGKSYVELYVSNPQGEMRRFISGKKRLGSIAWGPDSQFIYFIAQRGENKFASVYKIAIDGGEAELVVEALNDISDFSINHDSSGLTYIAKPKKKTAKEELEKKGFKANVYEESKERASAYFVNLVDRTKPHMMLDLDEHILSIDYHPTKNQLLMRTAPTPHVDDKYVASQYRIVEQDGLKRIAFKTEGKLSSAEWSPNGRYVAMIGAEDRHDPASGRLFVAESKSGDIVEVNKGYSGHVRDLQWLSEYQLAFLGHIGTKSEVAVINIDSGSINQHIKPGEQVLTAIHADNSGKFIVGVASSSSYPKEVVNISNKSVVRVSHSNKWLDSVELPKQETINYIARDGVKLQGVLIYPQDYSKRKKYPLIMMVHGGPESHVSDGWLDKYTYPIKYAASQGFAVFLPNYRGSTARGVEFSKMGQADYAGAEFDDLVDAITHLSNIGLVDKKRVGITGGSYGGYASAWAATALSEHFAASVMFVGISNQLSKFGTTDIPKEMHNVHARNYPWDKWQWMLERSPIYHTDKANTPILILHGKKDTRVHPSQSMELYRYIKTRTDTPARLVFYPNEAHGNKKSAAQLDYSMRLMRWMEFYLKGKKKGKKMPPYELEHVGFPEKIAK